MDHVWKLVAAILCVLATATARRNSGERPRYRTAYACEGSKLDIICEEGHLIHLIRANYGRYSISICNEHGNLDWSVDCMSHRSFRVMQRSCASKNRCSLPAVTSLFGDSCPGTLKYLEAHYQCLPEASSATTTLKPSPPPIVIPPGVSNGTQKAKPTTTPIIIRPTTTTTTTEAPTTTTTLSSTSSILIEALTTQSITKPSTTFISTSPELNEESESTMSEDSLHLYCPPINQRGLLWNWTKAGDIAIQRCPGGATGEARWQCSYTDPPHWVTSWPDLSDCNSLWVESLKERVQEGHSVVNIAAELAIMTQAKPLYGGDVINTVDILNLLVSHMDTRISEFSDDKQRHQVVKELLQWVIEIGNNLLNGSHDNSWNDLSHRDQRQVASELLQGMEDNALLLADTQGSDHQFNYAQDNVMVSVNVIEMHKITDVNFPPQEVTSAALSTPLVEDSIHLPAEALIENIRFGLSKVVFLTFNPKLGSMLEPQRYLDSTILNSRIVSVSLGKHKIHRLSHPVIVTLKHLKEENVTNPLCVFWNYDIRDWSEEGCHVVRYNHSHTVCSCNHLTNFAVLMDVQAIALSSGHQKVLEVLTYCGCIISIICLIFTILTFQIFPVLKNDRTTIHKNLCICLLIAEVIFVAGIEQTTQRIVCGLIAGFLHYFFLAAFMWMFIEGFQLYVMLIEVFETEKSRINYYYALAYGIPAIIVGSAAFIDPTSYGTDQHCWLRTDNYFIFSFVGPVILILLANSIFLSIAIFMMCRHSSIVSSVKNKEHSKLDAIRAWIRGAVVLVFLLGLTWAFGLFYLNKESVFMAYLFTIFNTLQGLFIFVFHCVKNDKVQKEYQKFLHRKHWLPICLHNSKADRRSSFFINSNGSAPPTSGDLNSPQHSWSFHKDRKSSTNSSFLKSTTTQSQTCEPDHPDIGRMTIRSSFRYNGKSPLDENEVVRDLSAEDCSEVENDFVSEYCSEKLGVISTEYPKQNPQHYGHLSEKSNPIITCQHRPFADHIYETIDEEANQCRHLYPTLYPQLEGHLRSHSTTSCGDHHPLIPPCLPERNLALAQLAHVLNSTSLPQPQCLHQPIDVNSSVVMAVLDGERVVCRLHPTEAVSCHNMSQLSTDC